MDTALLKGYGIDYATGISRCANDTRFYRLLLKMFLEDESFARAEDALKARDMEELFSCLHELKGACGNVALAKLHSAVSPLVELLRAGVPYNEGVDTMMDQVRAAYTLACDGIDLLLRTEA